MNIYLDIDGVLLKKDGTLANYFEEFLEFFVSNHNIFWLTTHCRGGENNAIRHISRYNEISERSLELLQKIKPTDWKTLKTEGIDFSQPFSWIDDCIMDAEKKVLLENNSLTCLHEVNPKEYDELKNLMEVVFERPAVVWQRFDFNLSFSKKDFELIKKGFHSNKGMDERWRFVFYGDTLYIMRHWTAWVNYKIRFREEDGRYYASDSFISNLAEQEKKGELTPFEKNYNLVFIIWLIEHYLLHNKKIFFSNATWFQVNLKIPIDSIHGYSHWKKVEEIGHYLADKNGADKDIISSFAFLHDIGRTTEAEEPMHGEKSAEIIKKVFRRKELGLDSSQYEKLLEAVINHDKAEAKNDDITIQTCWDADRLDLPRVNIIPDKNLLYTEIGKSDETFANFGIRKVD